MTTRAERRRQLREVGQRRASGKRGRRGAIRKPVEMQDTAGALQRLYAQGVTVAKPRIWTPGSST